MPVLSRKSGLQLVFDRLFCKMENLTSVWNALEYYYITSLKVALSAIKAWLF
jgi:hypothetical protein